MFRNQENDTALTHCFVSTLISYWPTLRKYCFLQDEKWFVMRQEEEKIMSSKATRKRYLEQECKNIRKRVEKFLGNDRSFLEEPYGTRRQKAILNYLDKAENDFGSYGLNSVIKAFANQELVPLLNYDEINYDFELSIGAAIWMLNKLRANNEASEVYKAIPPSDDWFYALPIDFSYPSYSNNLINSVVQLLTFRYEKKPISGDHPRE